MDCFHHFFNYIFFICNSFSNHCQCTNHKTFDLFFEQTKISLTSNPSLLTSDGSQLLFSHFDTQYIYVQDYKLINQMKSQEFLPFLPGRDYGLNKQAQNDSQQRYSNELKLVKKSSNYKQILSVISEKSGLKKIFCYHYSEQERWRLGAGSYGEVYVCYFQQVMTTRVHKFALKVIMIPSSITEVKKIQDTVATTRQEIKSLLKLRQNPNIIKIQDVIGDIKNNRIYLILQFCNNNDLPHFFDSLKRKGLLVNEDEILYYFKQILNGYRDLYKYNIIHRDIKPQNILAHNNTLKIADFGLSQQLFQKMENLHENRMIGTLQTSAPQLIFKDPYTNKCDIYSLGITLYWMLFKKYPYDQKMDYLDKDQFLKQSIFFQGESIRVSVELAQLVKSMVAYKQSDRIDWQDLFNHPILERIKGEEKGMIRQTIGRNLQGQNLSLVLDNTIPAQFYLYIGENSELDLNMLLQNSQNKQKTQCFMKIFMQGVNFKYKVHFLKMLLREIHELNHSQKIKNKSYFSIIKDLLRLGIENYIIFLNKAYRDELNGLNVLHILDLRMLNQINTSKYFYFYVEKFNIEVENYQNSHRKQKISKIERQTLLRNCQKYAISDKLHLILKEELLIIDEKVFLQQIKKCIVELIFFVKQEVRYYADQVATLADLEYNRYRQLILLIHHLYMFILKDKIFPQKYDPEINYDTQRFIQLVQYGSRPAFLKLARQINQIIARFEN